MHRQESDTRLERIDRRSERAEIARLRRQLEEANARHEELELALANAMTGISRLDPQGCFVEVREGYAELLGYRPEEMIGMSWQPTVHPDELDRAAAAYRDMLEHDRSEVELQAMRKDGSVFTKQILLVKKRDPEGRFAGHYCFMRDVSERRRAEDALRQSQKMEAIGRLAGGVAHDFNNLLTVILGNCENLLDRTPETDPSREEIGEIRRAARTAARVTAQLLAFARRQTTRPRRVDLNGVLDDARRLLERLIGEDIRIDTLLDPALPAVEIDPTQLEQVIVNLAVNARDAMPDGGSLRLETYVRPTNGSERDLVCLSVIDEGAGIEPELIDRIFEPFFTTKKSGHGTGLGLSTVHGIIEQAGGTIEVESRSGGGSIFRVLIPSCEAAGIGEASRSDVEPGSAPGGGETILLVEDDDAVRRTLATTLRRLGYAVLEASSAHQALELLGRSARPPALLLSDVVMPGLSGPALARRVHALHPAIAVVFVTGHADQAFDDGSLAEGAWRVLPKPVETATLARTLREALPLGA